MGWVLEHTGVATLSVPMEKVVGWQRAGHNRKTGANYTQKATRKAEQAVASAFADRYGSLFRRHDGPIAVRIMAWRELAKSNPKYRAGEPDTSTPDADNISKLVLDALNGTAWKDDAQVIDLKVRKGPRRPHGSGSWLRIEIHYYRKRYEKPERKKK